MAEPVSGDRVRTALDRWHETIGARLLRVICPLYREGHHRPDPVGTGVVIRVSNLVFIATAAHVLEDLGTGPRYVGVLDELLPLPALQFTSKLPSGISRDADRFDLGAAVFDPATAARFPSGDALSISQLDFNEPDSIEPRAKYFVHGYPASRQPRRLAGDTFEAMPFSFMTSELSASEYSSIQLDSKQNLLVGFNKDDTFRNLERSVGPNLDGVSGGALWRLSGDSSVSPRMPLLSAIAISWRSQLAPLGVVGTRIGEWVRWAAAEFPEAFAAHVEHTSRSQMR